MELTRPIDSKRITERGRYNYNSLTWKKAILGMFPRTNHDCSEVAVRSL